MRDSSERLRIPVLPRQRVRELLPIAPAPGEALNYVGDNRLHAMGTGSLHLYTFAVVIALALNYAIIFGAQSNLCASQFPPELRYSGISMGIHIAAALGGGLAPLIASWLVKHLGDIGSVGIYLRALGLIGALSTWLMKPTSSD
jgi:MHS family shikimate/dehydroshikimate transporter-like MFS transporter